MKGLIVYFVVVFYIFLFDGLLVYYHYQSTLPFKNDDNIIIVKKRIVKYNDYNFTILDQVSQNKRPNLICQNISDIPWTPILKVTDDFLIPPMSTFIVNNIPYGIDNCKTLIFTISYFRNRNTFDPDNIVLTLMKDNNNYPGESWYTKTFLKPINGWNLNINDPGSLILKLNIGDKDNYGKEFDLSSSSIIYSMKIWVSFYVTLKRDFILTGYKENMFYWIIYQLPPQGIHPTETDSPYKYYNKTSQFYFIDYNNLLRKNLTSWTSAKEIDRIMEIQDSTYNMAWKVDLLCKQTINIIPIPDSPSSNNNTFQPPSIQPSPHSIQPPAPIGEETTKNSNEIYIILVIFILSFVFCFLVFLLFYFKRFFKKEKAIDLNKFIQEEDSAIQLNPITEINKQQNEIEGITQRKFIDKDMEIVVDIETI